MGHDFLSDDWFAAVKEIAADAPEPPASMAGIVINIVVKDLPSGGNAEMRLDGGKMEQGLADGAPTTLNLPFQVAYDMFITGDQQAAMNAFMSGQITVDGDMGQLMALQGAGGGAGGAEIGEKIKAITN